MYYFTNIIEWISLPTFTIFSYVIHNTIQHFNIWIDITSWMKSLYIYTEKNLET